MSSRLFRKSRWAAWLIQPSQKILTCENFQKYFSLRLWSTGLWTDRSRLFKRVGLPNNRDLLWRLQNEEVFELKDMNMLTVLVPMGYFKMLLNVEFSRGKQHSPCIWLQLHTVYISLHFLSKIYSTFHPYHSSVSLRKLKTHTKCMRIQTSMTCVTSKYYNLQAAIKNNLTCNIMSHKTY